MLKVKCILNKMTLVNFDLDEDFDSFAMDKKYPRCWENLWTNYECHVVKTE